jgi:hypothetical protein
MFRIIIALISGFGLFLSPQISFSQEEPKPEPKKQDHQIYFKAPVKEIHHILYDKNFLPIQGEISEDKKSVKLKEWEQGTKVRLKVTYEDGTVDEIVKSPCFIDPVIL